MDSNQDMSILLAEFIEDAASHLDAAEGAFLELEQQAAAGTFDEGKITLVLGNLHTLKGNAGMMGFAQVQQFVHRLEGLLKPAAESSLPLSAGLTEMFYASVNVLRDAFRHLSDDPAAVLDFGDELMALDYAVLRGVQDGSGPALLPEKTDEHAGLTRKSTTVKVNFERLDELLNLVGELVIHRTTLSALEKRLNGVVGDRALLEEFNEASQLIGKSAAGLREAIMKVRMLPVRVVFQRFTRLVRDLSRSHGKQITLICEGEETELDKTVIDEIGEPLLHLIRNAVDHGIESPSERSLTGKPAGGTIRLQARHESNHIVIVVTDDGHGMRPARLKELAVAKGVLDDREARSLSDHDALQLVFAPGFSTSRQVTETSGRGIGLDVVKKAVTSLNGTIEIDSIAGSGTSFTIRLPLTLAIITALLVEVNCRVFAIPLSGVLESLRIDEADIHRVAAGEVIRLRDRLIPVFRLKEHFGIEQAGEDDRRYAVIVGNGEKRGAVVVDRLVGQQEIVIKAMDNYLGDLPGIAGGTVLGDGRISLIVDVTAFLGNK